MRIAVLSDIHGNDVALKAVLAKAKESDVERLFILGDIVGYYYHPDEVLRMLSYWQTDMIAGNHERMFFDSLNNSQTRQRVLNKYGHGLEFALERLTKVQKDILLSLPKEKLVEVDNIICRLCHGSPLDPDQYLYPDSDRTILDSLLDGEDFIFVGHSHYPFVYKHGSCQLINVGSVGQSRMKGGVADWCILDTIAKEAFPQETNYPTDILAKEAFGNDPEIPYLREVLNRRQNEKH